jgi:hypothetical protein
LNVNNLRLPHPSRLSAFFITFPGVRTFEKSLTTRKCWL